MAINRRTFVKKAGATGVALTFMNSAFSVLAKNIDYEFKTPFLRLSMNENVPAFQTLGIDAFGEGAYRNCALLETKKSEAHNVAIERVENSILYTLPDRQGKRSTAWEVSVQHDVLTLSANPHENNLPFEISVNQVGSHCTVLGIFKEKNQITFPCLIHMPDLGTFRVTCDTPGVTLFYDASREIRTAKWVKIAFPIADDKKVTFQLKSVTLYPEAKSAPYNGLKRNFINIFQVNPRLGVLANNSSSDPCAFTLYLYTELARETPELAPGLWAMDLIGMTLNRYISGMKAYGLVGFTDKYEGADTISWKSPYNSLDSLPSLLISSCYYINWKKDLTWANNSFPVLLKWAEEIYNLDVGNTGLIKHQENANSGSWKGTSFHRPSNWWDTIGFGHEDAYSNALIYRAFTLFADIAKQLGKKVESKKFDDKAKQLKSVYYSTFYNPATGVLAGWRSQDGKLHDYYFTFVSGVAITYGLVEGSKARAIMDKMLVKMKEVGYTDFSLGLPGNLVSIRREDYTHREHRWGGGEKEDGSDAFQIYENGGATSCFSYFTVRALQLVGKNEESEKILQPILKSIANGNFSGKCENGMSRDWRKWNGECWGYEGFLVDNYLVVLAEITKK
jgi:hypothetical protein